MQWYYILKTLKFTIISQFIYFIFLERPRSPWEVHAEPLGLRGAQVGNLCSKPNTEESRWIRSTAADVPKHPHRATEVNGSSFLRVGYMRVEALFTHRHLQLIVSMIWLWSIGGIIMTNGNRSTRRKTSIDVTLSTTNPIHWSVVTLIMDLTGTVGVDWIPLAQETDKWQTLVNTRMVLWGSLNTCNFFTTLWSIRFSKGTLVHRIDSFSVKIDYNCYVTHLTSRFSCQNAALLMSAVAYPGGVSGVKTPPPRNSEGPPKNRAKFNTILKTVKKNCWIYDANTPRCLEKRQ